MSVVRPKRGSLSHAQSSPLLRTVQPSIPIPPCSLGHGHRQRDDGRPWNIAVVVAAVAAWHGEEEGCAGSACAAVECVCCCQCCRVQGDSLRCALLFLALIPIPLPNLANLSVEEYVNRFPLLFAGCLRRRCGGPDGRSGGDLGVTEGHSFAPSSSSAVAPNTERRGFITQYSDGVRETRRNHIPHSVLPSQPRFLWTR